MARPRTETSVWTRIDSGLAEVAPEMVLMLREGASETELAWLSQVAKDAGKRPDPALLEAYRAHDGADDHPAILALLPTPKELEWARYCTWLPLAEAREELLTWREAVEDFPAWLLPIGADGGGNSVLVSLSTGEVAVLDHEKGEVEGLNVTFADFVKSVADALDAGRVQETEEGLVLVEAPARSSKPPQPTDHAATMIALLADKNMLLLDAAPSKKLLSQVAKVLTSTMRPSQRAKALYDIFDEHDEIADVFIDDETFEAFLEAFG